MTADQETPYTTVQKRDAIAQELASRLRVYQRAGARRLNVAQASG